MIRPDLACVLALSCLPLSLVKRIRSSLEEYSIRDISKKLSLDAPDKVLPHIAAAYSGNCFAVADQVMDRCSKKGITMLHYYSDSYPRVLKEIANPPLVLFCQGDPLFDRSIAIVGTRKSSGAANSIARRFASLLSQDGFSIVSGMASGIDREAHVGALSLHNPTIAVLGNGSDICYPRQNRDLYEAILQSGNSALVSEFPPGVRATRWSFVQRNRIISGLCCGTLVVQAGEKSGALSTARYALEQNREVFVCPGLSFDASYSGCHRLIKDGAVLVSDLDDIYDELPAVFPRKNNAVVANHESGDALADCGDSSDASHSQELVAFYENGSLGRKIIELLLSGQADLDTLIRECQVSASHMNEILIDMELAGHIFRAGNKISL